MKSEKKKILDQLKSEGSGFRTPPGYFKSLEDRFTGSSLDVEPIVDEVEPKEVTVRKLTNSYSLERMPKDHGFRVPDGYFEQGSTDSGLSRDHSFRILKNWNPRILYLAVAASILLFFGIQYFNTRQDTNGQMAFKEDEIANWIENDLVSLSSNEITEAFSDVEWEEALYPQEEVYAYLNDIDIENLILEN